MLPIWAGVAVLAPSIILGAVMICRLTVSRWRQVKRQARVVIEYRDAFGSGEWCAFETIDGAIEAEAALNDAYAGRKVFWINEASVRTGKDYLTTVQHVVTMEVPPPAPPRPRVRPKPGTPNVRQVNGIWQVRTGNFEMSYGAGALGYKAALEAVERAHKG